MCTAQASTGETFAINVDGQGSKVITAMNTRESAVSVTIQGAEHDGAANCEKPTYYFSRLWPDQFNGACGDWAYAEGAVQLPKNSSEASVVPFWAGVGHEPDLRFEVRGTVQATYSRGSARNLADASV